MDWKSELFGLFGIKLTHLIAGLSAGFVRHFFTGGSIIAGMVSTLVGLIITLNVSPFVYLAVTTYFSWTADPRTEHAVVFFVGILGLFGCEGLIKLGAKWRDNPTLPTGIPKP